MEQTNHCQLGPSLPLLAAGSGDSPTAAHRCGCGCRPGSAEELAHIASRRGVLIAPGSRVSPTGGFGEFIRLPFDYGPAVLQEAICRLASAWRAYHAQLRSHGSSRIDVIV